MTNKVIKVGVVDDHKIVTDGLRAVLSSHEDIEILDIASSGEQLLSQLVNQQPDIIIMDYSLRNISKPHALNGLETAIKVKEIYPHIKILMLTMYYEMEIIVPCIEAGVDGYMLKGESDFDIYKAIKQVYGEGHYFSPEIAPQLVSNFKKLYEPRILVTDREREILMALSSGMTAKEVAALLKISRSTVENHKGKLLEKFGAQNTIELLFTAVKQGVLRVDNL